MTADRAVRNEFGQPIGPAVPGWEPRQVPAPALLAGTVVDLVAFGPQHVADLFRTTCGPGTEDRWTYMPGGPFADIDQLAAYCAQFVESPAWVPMAIVDRASGVTVGMACYLRIDPANGSVEVGAIMYGPSLAGTRGATEAMYLMAGHAFDDLGYRRYEWKCDALNQPSRDAAARLGFVFEGVFRQAVVYKGRNRDTAWFAITDQEWARVRPAYQTWLADANFDADGRQRQPLRALIDASAG